MPNSFFGSIMGPQTAVSQPQQQGGGGGISPLFKGASFPALGGGGAPMGQLMGAAGRMASSPSQPPQQGGFIPLSQGLPAQSGGSRPGILGSIPWGQGPGQTGQQPTQQQNMPDWLANIPLFGQLFGGGRPATGAEMQRVAQQRQASDGIDRASHGSGGRV